LAKQAIAEGVQLVICIDELHVLLDSKSLQGYRTFQAMWTMMASLNAYDYLLFATSATVRPKVEAVLAQELGLDEGWRSDNLCCTVIRCRN
jgi:hypothetical protein